MDNPAAAHHAPQRVSLGASALRSGRDEAMQRE